MKAPGIVLFQRDKQVCSQSSPTNGDVGIYGPSGGWDVPFADLPYAHDCEDQNLIGLDGVPRNAGFLSDDREVSAGAEHSRLRRQWP